MMTEEDKLQDEITSLYYLNMYSKSESDDSLKRPLPYSSYVYENSYIPFPNEKTMEEIGKLDKVEPSISKYYSELISDLHLLFKT
jgi:hypothetical protein